MKPRHHVLFGLLFSILLFFVFDVSLFGVLLFFSSSILIDLDHVSRYVFRTGDVSPWKFFAYYAREFSSLMAIPRSRRSEFKYPLFVFHGFESLLVLALVSFWFSFVWFVFVGFLFHLLCDYVHMVRHGTPFGIKVSALYVLFRNRGRVDVPI